MEFKKLCKCGCGGEIIIKPHHKYTGIPDYIHNHHLKNKKMSQEQKNKISKSNTGKKLTGKSLENVINAARNSERNQKISKSMLGDLNHNWKGGHDKTQPYLVPINQCLKLNKRFPGSEGHHISKSIVIFIPSELHKHISHSLKNDKNMYEINMLAIQFINRGF